jgi:BMFP domain-containing protein YqiC
MGQKGNSVWEKILSVLLSANIAVMGWLWTNVARLADRLDRHTEDRAIHAQFERGELVARGEFEAWREGELADGENTRERLARLEDRLEKALTLRTGQ